MTTLGFVFEWALRSSVMILACTLLLRLFATKNASFRLAGYVAVLCGSLIIPMLTAAMPGLPLTAPGPAQLSQRAAVALNDATAVIAIPESRQEAPLTTRFDWRRMAMAAYALVAGILLLRLCVGTALGLRLKLASRRTGLTSGDIEVRESDDVKVPVTLGIVHSAIVLPADWREWDQTKLLAVLAHEDSHVRRRDPLVQAVSALHRALLWLTPASWFLHKLIVRSAEEASDDAALATVRDRESYASILLDFMRKRVPAAAWQGVRMARYGRPEARIRHILNASMVSRGVTWGSAVAILAMVSPLTYVAAAAHPQQAPPVPVLVVPLSSALRAIPDNPVAASAPRPQPAAQAQTAPQATRSPVATKSTAATQAPAGGIRQYIIVSGNSMSGSWNSDEVHESELRARFGDKFAWFRENGREYIVTDSAVLSDLDKAMEPQKDVNRKQADVNSAQARVNELQAKVNAHQGNVNAQQKEVNRRQDIANQVQTAVDRGGNAALIEKLEAELRELRANKPEANQTSVNRMQSQVNEEQAQVNAGQAKVNLMQQKVNAEQHRVSAEFSRRVQEILGSALQRGAATEVK